MPKEYFAKKENKRSGGGPFLQTDRGYGQGKNPITMSAPLKDWERFKAGVKGALRGAAANEGTVFPGYDPQGKYSKWGGKYPGSDIIQGWRGGVGMYDKKKADARRKQEEGKQE